MVLIDVFSRGTQDSRTGKMDSPMVNVQRAATDQEVLSQQAFLRRAFFLLNRRKIFIVLAIGVTNEQRSPLQTERGKISSVLSKIFKPHKNIITFQSFQSCITHLLACISCLLVHLEREQPEI